VSQNLFLSAWLIWPLLQLILQSLKSQVSSVFRGPFCCLKPIWKHLEKGMWQYDNKFLTSFKARHPVQLYLVCTSFSFVSSSSSSSSLWLSSLPLLVTGIRIIPSIFLLNVWHCLTFSLCCRAVFGVSFQAFFPYVLDTSLDSFLSC